MAQLFRLKDDIQIHTDHRNLVYLLQRKELSKKLLRWVTVLSDYTFTISHISGNANVMADMLSRVQSTCRDSHSLNLLEAEESEVRPSLWDISEAQASLPEEHRIGWEGLDGCTLVDSTYFVQGVPIIPDGKLRDTFLQLAHQFHTGSNATYQMLKKMGFWPSMLNDVRRTVKRCPICLKSRIRNYIEVEAGSSLRGKPWETVAVDTIGPLPLDNLGARYIVTAVDMFTRYTELIPVASDDARTVAQALWDRVFTRYGVPLELQSDGGPEYANSILDAMLTELKVLRHFTIPYHPQSNGLVERRNAEIGRHLRWMVLAIASRDEWATLVPTVQMILNGTTHTATQFSPHELIFGQPHNLFSTEWDGAEWGDKRIVEFKQSLQEVLRTLEDSVREGTSARSQIETKGVEVGDYVLWKHENPKKLDCPNRGPWKIHEVLPNHKVKLQSIVTGDIRVTHVDKLMPFETDLEETQMKQLAESDKEQFEIEKIEKIDWKTGMVTIKWKNYDERTEQHLRSVSHVEEVKRRARKARKNLANYV
ncbi:hypothetical protein J8273_0470 [Carpediemonas membranifera]|uniref:Integrase catalytic domain-containing protein n=1 Tax=Carpediemonas membranifera TaxID=201153 RepID=A0A8J6B8B8_9EUKA|nr:hypothetical protein J8273_0470 [Carpediemonas membranifera]|eukprot:KAG9395249.1 hypothetical protein J8273_0470 [Carpediemonas membranifera]